MRPLKGEYRHRNLGLRAVGRWTETRGMSVLGGSAILFGSRLAASAIGYVGTAAAARTLSVENWGGFTFVLSLLTLVSLVFDFQVGRRVLSEVLAEDTADRTVGSFMVLRCLMGVVAFAVGLVVVFVGSYEANVQMAMLVGGVVLLLAPTSAALTVLFQAQVWFLPVAVATVVARVASVTLMLGLTIVGVRTLAAYLVPSLLYEALVLAALIVVAQRRMRLRPHIDLHRWLIWIKESVPIAFGAAMGAIYFRVDALMLSMMDDLSAVGYYGAGYKLMDIIAYLPSAIMAPTFTLFVVTFPQDPAGFRHTFRGAAAVMAITALAVTTGCRTGPFFRVRRQVCACGGRCPARCTRSGPPVRHLALRLHLDRLPPKSYLRIRERARPGLQRSAQPGGHPSVVV